MTLRRPPAPQQVTTHAAKRHMVIRVGPRMLNPRRSIQSVATSTAGSVGAGGQSVPPGPVQSASRCSDVQSGLVALESTVCRSPGCAHILPVAWAVDAVGQQDQPVSSDRAGPAGVSVAVGCGDQSVVSEGSFTLQAKGQAGLSCSPIHLASLCWQHPFGTIGGLSASIFGHQSRRGLTVQSVDSVASWRRRIKNRRQVGYHKGTV